MPSASCSFMEQGAFFMPSANFIKNAFVFWIKPCGRYMEGIFRGQNQQFLSVLKKVRCGGLKNRASHWLLIEGKFFCCPTLINVPSHSVLLREKFLLQPVDIWPLNFRIGEKRRQNNKFTKYLQAKG